MKKSIGPVIAAKLTIVFLVIALLVLVVPWVLPRPGLDGTIPERPFPDSRFADIGGVRMHWRERLPARRDGQALVVLLHGFGASGFSWRHTLDTLEADGHAVIAPDVPPFGYSERTASGPEWPALVLGVADRVRPGSDLVLVGHSMGAGVAADVAAMAPDRVRQIVMVDGTPALRRGGGYTSRLLAVPSFARAAEVFAAWRLVKKDAIAGLLESAFGRAPTEEELDGYFRPLTIPGTYPILLRRLAQRGAPDDAWAKSPTSVVWGEHDDWVPRQHADKLLAAHPEFSPIRVIAGAGHNPMDTHPDALNRLLIELIRDWQPAPTGDGQ